MEAIALIVKSVAFPVPCCSEASGHHRSLVTERNSYITILTGLGHAVLAGIQVHVHICIHISLCML